MKHYLCRKCHHEWDGESQSCGWCGEGNAVLMDDDKRFTKFIQRMMEKVDYNE